MPGLDGTGPSGLGPMTGGGFGRCADGSAGVRRGAGRGAGAGRGRRFTAESYRGAYDNSDIAGLREENAALGQKINELISAVEELKADTRHK